MDHDTILQRHRSKFDAHRDWLKQQQEAIRSEGPSGANTARTIGSTPRSTVDAQQNNPNFAHPPPTHRTSIPPQDIPPPTASRPAPYSQGQRVEQTAAAAQWVDAGLHNGYAPSPPPDNDVGAYDQFSMPQQSQARQEDAPPTYHYSSPPPQQQAQPQYQPQYDTRSNGSYPSTEALLNGNPLNVHSRASLWSKKRQQKLLEMRQKVINKELENCSFTPSVRHGPFSPGGRRMTSDGFQLNSPFARGLDQSSAVEAVSGFEGFIQRKQRARDQEREKAQRLQSDGRNWKRESTVVQEFNLACYNNVHCDKKLRQVLKQPVAAPKKGVNTYDGLKSPGVLLSSGIYMPQGGFSGGHLAAHNNSAGRATSQTVAPPALPPKGTFSTMGSSEIVEMVTEANSRAEADAF